MFTDNSYQYDAFISYSHKDNKWVRETLLPALEKEDVKVTIDFRDFKPGDFIVRDIENAINRSRKTIIVLSQNYLESDWTEFENMLIHTIDPAAKARRIIPILVSHCELPIRIRALSYLDFTNPRDFKSQLHRLVLAVRDEGATVDGITTMSSTSHLRPYILIVEDEENWQKLLKRLLREQGYDVETVSNFSQALKTIIKSSAWLTKFDLALCVVDLNLNPEYDEDNWDGLGLLAICKLSAIPTIVVSGEIGSRGEHKLKSQFGARAVFPKQDFPETNFIEDVKRFLQF